jgi:hypothetical protein
LHTATSIADGKKEMSLSRWRTIADPLRLSVQPDVPDSAFPGSTQS